jgi:hypothetical protein
MYATAASASSATGCITAQLIDAANATHVWAERYDRALDDIFALQDELTMSVVGAIEPSLRQAEVERARRKRPDSLDAYDLYLRVLPFASRAMPEDADAALPLLEQAIQHEPEYAVAYALLSWCHEQRYMRGGLREDMRAAASPHARAAAAFGVTMPRHWRWAALSSAPRSCKMGRPQPNRLRHRWNRPPAESDSTAWRAPAVKIIRPTGHYRLRRSSSQILRRFNS